MVAAHLGLSQNVGPPPKKEKNTREGCFLLSSVKSNPTQIKDGLSVLECDWPEAISRGSDALVPDAWGQALLRRYKVRSKFSLWSVVQRDMGGGTH